MPASARLRTLQIVTALIYCLFSVGICFGFAALKPILISSGVYSDRCFPGDRGHGNEYVSDCVEQEIALNQMFTWAAVGTNVSAFPIGLILDAYGPRIASLIGTVLMFLGTLGLRYASNTFDIYVPAYTVLATAGSFLLLSSFSLAALVPGKSGLIVSAMTGAFDASSGLFLIYRLFYQAFHSPSIKTFFTVYLVVPIAIMIVQILYMPKTTVEAAESAIDETTDDTTEADVRQTHPRQHRLSETTNLLEHSDDSYMFESAKELVDPITGVMHDASTKEILLSGWFLGPAFVMITSLIRVNFYIATVNAQLPYFLNEAEAATVKNLFDILLPAGGILAIPLIGWILDSYTTSTVYFLTFCLSLTSGLLSFIPNKYFQILHVMTFVVLRPWIYSILPGTVTKSFGNERFGAFYGLIMAVAGLVNLLAHDLEVLTYTRFAGSFVPVNVMLVCLSVASLALTVVYMRVKIARLSEEA